MDEQTNVKDTWKDCVVIGGEGLEIRVQVAKNGSDNILKAEKKRQWENNPQANNTD